VANIVPSRDKVEMNSLFTPVNFVWLRIDMHFLEARLPPFLNEIARLNHPFVEQCLHFDFHQSGDGNAEN
jgi:hypothetical protein